MKEELFVIIDGERKQLDLNTPSGITLDYQSPLCAFGNIEVPSYSYTINLPDTINNRRIFSAFDDLRCARRDNIFNAVYVVNGVEIFSGELYVLKNNISKEKNNSLEVYLKTPTDGLNDLIDKNESLRDLDNTPKENIDSDIAVYHYDGDFMGNEEKGYAVKDYFFLTSGYRKNFPPDACVAKLSDTKKKLSHTPILRAAYGAGVYGPYEEKYLGVPKSRWQYGAVAKVYSSSKIGLWRDKCYFGGGFVSGEFISPNSLPLRPGAYVPVWQDPRITAGEYLVADLDYAFRNLINLMHEATNVPITWANGLSIPYTEITDKKHPFYPYYEGEFAIFLEAPPVVPVPFILYFIEKKYGVKIHWENTELNSYCIPMVKMGQTKTLQRQSYIKCDFKDISTFKYRDKWNLSAFTYFLPKVVEEKEFTYDSKIQWDYIAGTIPKDKNGNFLFGSWYDIKGKGNLNPGEACGLRISCGIGSIIRIIGNIRCKMYAYNLDTPKLRIFAAPLPWSNTGQNETGIVDDSADEKYRYSEVKEIAPIISSSDDSDYVYNFSALLDSSELEFLSPSPYTNEMVIYFCLGGGDDDFGNPESGVVIEKVSGEVYIHTGGTEDISASPKIEEGVYINLFRNLPDMGCKDFLVSLGLALGASIQVKNRDLYFVTYGNVFASTYRYDWTDRIVISNSNIFSFEQWHKSLSRRTYFLMNKEDIDDYGNIVEYKADEDKYQHSTLPVIVDPASTEDDFTSIKSGFSGALLSRGNYPSLATGNTTGFWQTQGVALLDKTSKGTAFVRSEYYSAEPNEAITILAKYADIADVADPLSVFSYESNGDLAIVPWYFGIDDAWDDFADAIKKPVTVEEYMELTEFDLRDLDYTVPVYLDKYNAYFGIAEIERYDDGICKVIMFKLPMDKDYVIKYEPYVAIMPKQGGFDYAWGDEVWVALKIKAYYYKQDELEPFKVFDVNLTEEDIKVNFDHKYGSEEWRWDKERHTVVLTANPDVERSYHVQIFFEVNTRGEILDLSDKAVSYNRIYQ